MSSKHDRPPEEQRFLSQRNYALGTGGIYHREHVPVAKSRCNGPDLYISAENRGQMGMPHSSPIKASR